MDRANQTSSPRIATAVLLTRGRGADLEVFLVERSAKLRFFGGYWAFPGGVLDAIDCREGDGPEEAAQAALRRCALRELMEETGVLPAAFARRWPVVDRRRFREAWLAAEASGGIPAEVARAWVQFVDAEPDLGPSLTAIGRLTTPKFAPVRYQTQFFHLELDDSELPEVIPGELVQGRMQRPREVLERWRCGELAVVPPALFLLDMLGHGDLVRFRSDVARACAELERGRLHPVRFTPGIFVAPLRTPTLPPATTTNCLLVGEATVYVVDPATPHADERLRLADEIDRRIAAGNRVAGILLTHHHEDHVGAVEWVAQRFGMEVFAHRETHERLRGVTANRRDLHDSDRIELGTAPDGSPHWHLEVKHTPGHAPGHLCFVESRYRAAIVGDLVSTLSTIVIDPPEGHLRTYLRSIERMLQESIGVLYPAHGPAARDGQGVLAAYLEHRGHREQKLVAALRKGTQSVEQLLPQVYDDTDARMLPVAARSLLAGLLKLAEDGLAARVDDRWSLVKGG